VMALTMLGFEGNFLVSSQLYFHGYEHDPYRLQNQASSLITGISNPRLKPLSYCGIWRRYSAA
ncbi:hypothetical protein, partial [Candidatus Fukatsuia symbiotica]|uniref:hypothetical protein n=1 Tax=Candidatus Fukatsuia symbiotica TaxID=1878942 RepID=UPI0013C49403